ncbi:T9SS type A sorting domain-containing protein, partial [candidate division WOR-3 bacterium]|nr:T9SS type A sorting domain-containing protein [candidate division WOR-3 bacterium]
YTTTRKGPVSLKVYDIAGRLVRTLIDRNESAEHKTVYWDGKDDNHRSVAAGVFFYRLVAEEKTATKKMVLVR